MKLKLRLYCRRCASSIFVVFFISRSLPELNVPGTVILSQVMFFEDKIIWFCIIRFVLKIEGTSSCGKDCRGSGAVPERSAGMKAEAATPESLFFAHIRRSGSEQKAAQNKKNG